MGRTPDSDNGTRFHYPGRIGNPQDARFTPCGEASIAEGAGETVERQKNAARATERRVGCCQPRNGHTLIS